MPQTNPKLPWFVAKLLLFTFSHSWTRYNIQLSATVFGGGGPIMCGKLSIIEISVSTPGRDVTFCTNPPLDNLLWKSLMEVKWHYHMNDLSKNVEDVYSSDVDLINLRWSTEALSSFYSLTWLAVRLPFPCGITPPRTASWSMASSSTVDAWSASIAER